MRQRVVGWLLGLSFLLPLGLAAQAGTREVTGTVRSTDGGLIESATISVVGGTAATRSDAKGQYRIVVPSGEVTLVARFIGYRRSAKVVPFGVRTADFTLDRDILRIEQVTVTGQATTLESRNATTAIAAVAGGDLTKAPGQDVTQMLQGKVLGATINMNSGAPGGAGQIQIRGVTTVLGSGQPLIVLDGAIISNEGFSSGANTVTGAGGGIANSQDAVVNRLADINPNEIESIEILKSAAATAQYGSRATNGVVLIRTKRGAPGAPRVTLTQRVGTQNALRYLGSRRFKDSATIVNLPYGNGESGASYLAGRNVANSFWDAERNFFDNSDPSYETIGTVSGGSDRTQYFASMDRRRETGLAPNTGAELIAARINLDQQISDRVKASFGLNITRNTLRRGLSNNDNTQTSPIYAFAYMPNVINLTARDAQGNFIQNPFGGGGNATSNPFQTFEYLRYQEQATRQFGFGSLNALLLNDKVNRVDVTGQVGFDRFQQDAQLNSPAFLQYEGNDGFFGRGVQGNINQYNYNAIATATWRFTPSPLLNATTSVGASFETQQVNQYYLRSRGMLPGTTIVSQGTQESAQGKTEFKDQSYFGNTQLLLFNERMTVAGGFRADRSSANGDRSKWYVFPRVSASYRLDTPAPGVDNIKLRASYGQTGNRPRFTDRFILLGTGSVIGGNTSLVAPATVNNPGIKPERLAEVEGGLDLSLFNARVNFEATVFSRVLTDQLFTAPAPPSGGFSQLVVNAGELTTRGSEIGLSAIPVQGRNFTWTTRVGFQQFRMRVNEIPKTIPRFIVPGSFGAAFGRNVIKNGYPTTGIWGNVPVNPTTLAVLPYGTTITGVRGTDWITKDTLVADAQPDHQMLFNNSFVWGRWSLSGLFDWRVGGTVANMTRVLYDEGGNSRDYEGSSPAAGQQAGEYRYNAWAGGQDLRAYLQSGTNVRLRELALSYDAPAKWASTVGARSARFTFQGRNLWMLTDYWGYDPEFNNFGNTNLNRFIDLAPFPGVRQFFFSVDLGF